MIDAKDVIAALRREDPFDDPEAFTDIEPFVGDLVQLIEMRGWEDVPVNLEGACTIMADLLETMINSGYCRERIIARAALENLLANLREDANDMADTLERVNLAREIEGQSRVTEMELFLDQDALNDTAKELYRSGGLTYGLLATTSPKAYFQYESAD